MSEPYPWGTQAPTKKVAALESSIASNDAKKAEAVKRHRDEIRKFDEADKGLRAELKVAQGIVDKEKAEANAASATRVLMRMLATTSIDVEEALRTGDFEKAIADAFANVGGARPKRSKSKETLESPRTDPVPTGGSDGEPVEPVEPLGGAEDGSDGSAASSEGGERS